MRTHSASPAGRARLLVALKADGCCSCRMGHLRVHWCPTARSGAEAGANPQARARMQAFPLLMCAGWLLHSPVLLVPVASGRCQNSHRHSRLNCNAMCCPSNLEMIPVSACLIPGTSVCQAVAFLSRSCCIIAYAFPLRHHAQKAATSGDVCYSVATSPGSAPRLTCGCQAINLISHIMRMCPCDCIPHSVGTGATRALSKHIAMRMTIVHTLRI